MMPMVQRGGYQQGEGYLLIDDRVSGGTLTEVATMTCAHCSVVVALNPERRRSRGRCTRCARYVCDGCAALGECNYVGEMVDLALTYPGQGPFLARGPAGEPLYDTRLRDQHRIAGVGFTPQPIELWIPDLAAEGLPPASPPKEA
jgi:hypothetical protein